MGGSQYVRRNDAIQNASQRGEYVAPLIDRVIKTVVIFIEYIQLHDFDGESVCFIRE